ncbi:MAG TPA: hypothetical protein VJO53_09370 [Candidatus Acidoferrales bacterium]|nr:hypothetical protein [Candidatus Acidoferrales bacterium]
MTIARRYTLSILMGTLAMAGPALAGPQETAQGQPPSEEELHVRTQKLLANQHGDDAALELYERVERHVDRSGDPNPRTLADKTYRMVPNGSGTQRIVLRIGDKPVEPAEYNEQMEALEGVLRTMANSSDPRAKAAYAKRAKRDKDRADFLDAMKEAFIPKWLGSETRNGRACDVFELDPNPSFHPRSMFQDALTHVTAKIWVDHETTQLARGEARVMRDVSFGGGILGKLYRGSVVTIEQEPVAPGVWLPTHYQYDFAGRKFLFSFQQHALIDVTRYRRVGPPKEALQIVQNELANGKTFSEDP